MKAVWIVLLLIQCIWAAKRSNVGTSNRARTTTPSSLVPEEWRDPYIYSLFEMTLSAIDAKLRKVDTLDRTMEQMMRRIDSIDSRLSDTATRSDAILAQLKSVDGRLTQISNQQWTAGAVDNLEPQISALDEKVSVIGSKINVLAYQLDSNSLLWNNNNETGDFATSGSETSRAYTAVPPPANGPKPPQDAWAVNNSEEVDSIRTAMTSMDRHLKILIELFSEQMDKMMGMVNDVRGALVGQDHTVTPTTSTTVSPSSTEPSFNTTGRVSGNSKLDALFQKMTPLLDVSEKMDEVWNVLVGTKSSVDTLVPTSEALLWQTQRQERAISDIHTDLNVKTKQIIENLNLVERQLVQHQQQQQPPQQQPPQQIQQREIGGGNKPRSTKPAEATAAAAEANTAHKASESQVHVTYKQGTEGLPNRSSTLIRAQELSPGPVSSTTKSSPVAVVTSPAPTPSPAPVTPPADGTILTLPTDIMDSEFLHDDPLASVFKKTNSSRPVNASSSTTTSTTTTTTTSSSVSSSSVTSGNVPAVNGTNGTATSTVRSVPIQPAGPTERSRVPTNPAVIFPSVKNKPGFNNSTFFYDYTAPQNIRGYSCAELKEQGLTKSGIYYLLIRGTSFWYLKVYCDMEEANGGWTVIQRRDDYGENRENFNRDWDDYKSGFGDPDREFWLGNENIYMLTNAEDYSLRVELEDFEGNKRYAEYSSFKLYSEREQYKLEIGGYTGDAGDSLNDPWYGSNLSPFSTYNRDNDRSSLNCASMLKGGWWWKSCGRGLNGIYLTDPQDLTARQGIVWFRWRGWDYTLKRATMMIRPRHYGKEPSTPSP